MTNIFANAKSESAKGPNIEEDFLGGSHVLETDIYPAVIKTAYIQKSAISDANSIVLLLKVNDKTEIRSQTWVSNQKGGYTYKDKTTGEAKNQPGFSQMNSLAMILAGVELGDLTTEELKVNIYDKDAKKEIPTAVMCFTDLHGVKCNIALQKQTVDVTKKNETTGAYESNGETCNVNKVVKFFPEDNLVTISEVSHFITGLGGNLDDVIGDGELLVAIAKMDEDAGQWAGKWIEKNKGETYDKSSGKSASGAGKKFSGKSADGTGDGNTPAKKKTSLFND